jgi:DNA-binding IclR family transcriptional regulator
LEILSDGRWHLLEEIRQKTKLNDNQIQQITTFLKEYEFVAMDETKKEMKLEEAVKKFLT